MKNPYLWISVYLVIAVMVSARTSFQCPLPQVIDLLGDISGRVVLIDGTAVGGALVTSSSGQSTTTDTNGEFLLSDILAAGTVSLTFSSDGFINVTQTASVQIGTATQLTVTLIVQDTGHPTAGAEGQIIDAVIGLGVAGLTLEIIPGIFSIEDSGLPASATTVTDGC